MGLYLNFQCAHTFGVDTIPFIFALASNGLGNGDFGLLFERLDMRTRKAALIASLIDKIPVLRHLPITAGSRPHRTLTTADFLPPPIVLIVGGSFEPEQSQTMINPTWAIFRISRDRRVPRVACVPDLCTTTEYSLVGLLSRSAFSKPRSMVVGARVPSPPSGRRFRRCGLRVVQRGVAQTSWRVSSCHSSAFSLMVRQPTFILANLSHVVRPSGSSIFHTSIFPVIRVTFNIPPFCRPFRYQSYSPAHDLRDTALDFSKPVINAPCVRAGVRLSRSSDLQLLTLLLSHP